ncbi:2548_t:CDS:1 [Gigaspora margarita]|uniref:2548_t:CDS:1 n=1 Tax=Gigaspora margarita TaxID=4874 RepID=A0ABN7UXB5_GIGMA|nr:2548_t:CDS:1 [Gigaspora margarita]
MLSFSLYALILYDKYSNHIGPYQPIIVPMLFFALHVFICCKSILKDSPFLACYSWLLLHFGISIGGLVSPNFFQTKTNLSISVLNYARLFWGFNEETGGDKNKDPVDVSTKKIGSNIAYFIEIAKAKSKKSDLNDIKIKPYKIRDLCPFLI